MTSRAGEKSSGKVESIYRQGPLTISTTRVLDGQKKGAVFFFSFFFSFSPAAAEFNDSSARQCQSGDAGMRQDSSRGSLQKTLAGRFRKDKRDFRRFEYY